MTYGAKARSATFGGAGIGQSILLRLDSDRSAIPVVGEISRRAGAKRLSRQGTAPDFSESQEAIMDTMNAAMFNRFGDPAKVIRIDQPELPQPKPDQVIIKMTMSPVHNHDLMQIRGEYGVKPELPVIGGTEATGTISAVGSAVTDLKVGSRVAVAGAEQSWAEYFAATATSAVPVPDGVDDPTAAQILGMPMSSVLALDQFSAKPGDWILVNAGNGAVGKVIAAVGRARGINIVLLVRREQARHDLEELGFGLVFATARPGWKERLRAVIGGSRVAGAVDMVGGDAAGDLASFVSRHGLLLSLGAMSNKPVSIDAGDLIFNQITIRGFCSDQQFQMLTKARLRAMMDELFSLAKAGKLILPVEQFIPLDEAPRAMVASARSRKGKVLITA